MRVMAMPLARTCHSILADRLILGHILIENIPVIPVLSD